MDRLPKKVRALLPTLCEGSFLFRAECVLAFGNPGSGKTHLLCGIAHELVKHGHAVYFTSPAMLVQRLLAAKRDLRFSQEIKKLDRFAALFIDDIGYVQQDREEMEVLFTLLAERYERRSVLITIMWNQKSSLASRDCFLDTAGVPLASGRRGSAGLRASQ